MAWATYTAYMVICIHAVMRWHALRFGLGAKELTDNEAIKRLIVAAVPYYADYLDKVGPDGYHYILEALETKLLLEIDQMLVGAAADQASIQQAAEILRRSNVVLEQAAKEQDAA